MGCLEVKLLPLIISEGINIKPILFDDPADCLFQLLSIADELIYFVVNDELGRFVVPLIHNHRCIEHIYVYQDPQDEESSAWMADYSKTLAVRSSIGSLSEKIKEDIQSIMQRPARWSRSRALLTALCSQTSHFEPISESCEEDLSTYRIVVLDYDGCQLFNFSRSKIPIVRRSTIEECIESIEYDPPSSVFLIVSMYRPVDLHSILAHEAVHAAYIVTDVDCIPQIQTIPAHSKLCGIFVLNEDFLDQLTSDICFYRRMRVHIPNISIFPVESALLGKPNEEQVDFLRFQLFSVILFQIPSPLPADQNESHDQLLTHLSQANVTIDQLFKQFNSSVLEKSVDRLKGINRHIVSLSDQIKSSSTTTVYRAQLISQKDLAMIKDNPNALFAVQAFILASRSLSSIVKICRQATDNQLAVVLLELNLSEQASVMHILDSDLVVFKLGTLFRLVSTEYAPDNVLHVQLEYVNNAMQYIEHRLQHQIRHPLTWLTFGNYLEALKQSSAAEAYYKYLVTIIPDHPNIAAICNNMGQIPATITTTSQTTAALSFDDPPLEKLPPSDVGTEQIQVLRKMADISYRRQDYKTALDFYQQAMELDDDPKWKQIYQYKIDTLSHFYCPQVSCKKN